MNVCMAFLLLHVSSSAGDLIAFPEGIYSGDQIAERLSAPGISIKASPQVKARHFTVNLSARPRKEMLALFYRALGIEVVGFGKRRLLQLSIEEENRQRLASIELDAKVKTEYAEMLTRLRRKDQMPESADQIDKIYRAFAVYNEWACTNPPLFTVWYLSTHSLSDLRKRSFVYCGNIDGLLDKAKAPQWLRDHYVNSWFSVSSFNTGRSLYEGIADAEKRRKETRFFFRISYTPRLRSFFVIEQKVEDGQWGGLSSGDFLPIPQFADLMFREKWPYDVRFKDRAPVQPSAAETIQDWLPKGDRKSIESALLSSKSSVDGVEVFRYQTALLDGIPSPPRRTGLAMLFAKGMNLMEALKATNTLSDSDMAFLMSDCFALENEQTNAVLLPFLRLLSKLNRTELEQIQEALGHEYIVIDLGLVRKEDRQALHRVLRNIVLFPSNMMYRMEIDSSFYRNRSDDPFKDCYLEISPVNHGNGIGVYIGKYAIDREEVGNRVCLDYPHSELHYLFAVDSRCPFIKWSPTNKGVW